MPNCMDSTASDLSPLPTLPNFQQSCSKGVAGTIQFERGYGGYELLHAQSFLSFVIVSVSDKVSSIHVGSKKKNIVRDTQAARAHSPT
jgi:hypothetical protein